MSEWPSASRSSDPATSHMAEEKHTTLGKRAERARQVLWLVIHHPMMTSGELSRWMHHYFPNLSFSTCAETPHKRLSELEKKGLVTRCGERNCQDSGYLRVTWEATMLGTMENIK